MRTARLYRGQVDKPTDSDTTAVLLGGLSRDAVVMAWCALSLPAAIILRLFEPVLRAVMPIIAVLGMLVSVVLESSGRAPHFPFWGAMAFFMGCGSGPRLLRAASRLLM